MLELVDCHTYYGNSYVLQGMSLIVPDATVVALLGRNGMGKTTTIRSIMGFTPPRRGSIHFNGQDITRRPPHEIARLGIGLVPEGRRIFPGLSVEEHLTIAARKGSGSEAWTLERIYGLFPALAARLHNKGNQLSGGEQQMLAIGRALMTNPALLLMDEPSIGLAPIIVRQVGEIIATLKASGLSILLVEQNVPMAAGVADRVGIVSRGRVVFDASVAEFVDDQAIQARYLGVGTDLEEKA